MVSDILGSINCSHIFSSSLCTIDKSKAAPKSRRRSYGEDAPSIVPEGLTVRKPKVVAVVGDGSAQSAVSGMFNSIYLYCYIVENDVICSLYFFIHF